MPGNTSDNTTLAGFLEKIEKQYGRSDRVWIMDRGIPTEATLATMREGDAPVLEVAGAVGNRRKHAAQAAMNATLTEQATCPTLERV